MKVIETLIDNLLDIKWITGSRTDVIRGAIVLLIAYQFGADHITRIEPLSAEAFMLVLGVLTERAVKFAKEHKNGSE